MNFGELQDRVDAILIDAPAAVTTAIPSLINGAMRFLQRQHNYYIMRASQEYTTTEGTRVLGAAPSNFKEIRGQAQETRQFGEPRALVWSPTKRDAERGFGVVSDLDIGYPLVLFRSDPTNEAGASNLEVYPLPDGNSDYDDGEYRIRLYYWKYLAALSAEADTNWFTVNAQDWIVYRAAADGFGMDWDEEREAKFMARAAAELAEVKRMDKLAQVAGIESMAPFANVRAVRIAG